MFKVRVLGGDDESVRGMELGDVVSMVVSGEFVEVYPVATPEVGVEDDVGLIFKGGVNLFYGLGDPSVAAIWNGVRGVVLGVEELRQYLSRSEELVCEVYNLPV